MNDLYALLLTAHSWLRWLLLALAILAVARAGLGLARHRAWLPRDAQIGRWLAIAVDLQVLLGAVLWLFLFGRAGLVMSDPASRRLLLEHPLAMLLALVLVHLGQARARRQPADAGKFRQSLVFYGLALLVMLAMIPWERLL